MTYTFQMTDRYRIGVDLGGTKIEIIALSPAGEALLRERVPSPDGYAAKIDTIAGLVRQTEGRLGPALSVGIGTPGAVSPASGLIKNSNSTELNGRPLHRDMETALGRAVRLANDADCFALSEAVDGAGQGMDSVFGVIVGTGCGGGIVIKGALVGGPNAIAGEWGHNPLPWPRDEDHPPPACYCGRNGCLETYLSGPGLAADHARQTGERRDAAAIAAAADAGDAGAGTVLKRYADRMARGLASVINILDPEVIVLGGGVSNVHQLYTLVPGRWGRYVFSDRVDTILKKAVHGDSSGVRGAAWLGDLKGY